MASTYVYEKRKQVSTISLNIIQRHCCRAEICGKRIVVI